MPSGWRVLDDLLRFITISYDAFRVDGLNESTKKRINEKIKKYVLSLR